MVEVVVGGGGGGRGAREKDSWQSAVRRTLQWHRGGGNVASVQEVKKSRGERRVLAVTLVGKSGDPVKRYHNRDGVTRKKGKKEKPRERERVASSSSRLADKGEEITVSLVRFYDKQKSTLPYIL